MNKLIIISIASFLFVQCTGVYKEYLKTTYKTLDSLNAERCNLKPEIGPCKAIIPKYYYDKKEKKCKRFVWGGCYGVVPFNTREECEKQCDCK